MSKLEKIKPGEDETAVSVYLVPRFFRVFVILDDPWSKNRKE